MPETLQKGERQKQRENEIDDRHRFVLEHVVQAPVGGCGVEAVVLDVPTPMGEQSLGVLEQQPTVALDDHHDVLVVPLAEVEEGGLEVQAIADHGVEVPAVVGKDPFQLRLMRRWTSLSTSRNAPLSNCA